MLFWFLSLLEFVWWLLSGVLPHFSIWLPHRVCCTKLLKWHALSMRWLMLYWVVFLVLQPFLFMFLISLLFIHGCNQFGTCVLFFDKLFCNCSPLGFLDYFFVFEDLYNMVENIFSFVVTCWVSTTWSWSFECFWWEVPNMLANVLGVKLHNENPIF